MHVSTGAAVPGAVAVEIEIETRAVVRTDLVHAVAVGREEGGGQEEVGVLDDDHLADDVIPLVLLDDGRVRASGPLPELLTRLDLPLAHRLQQG